MHHSSEDEQQAALAVPLVHHAVVDQSAEGEGRVIEGVSDGIGKR
jgi:hypothetical protein